MFPFIDDDSYNSTILATTFATTVVDVFFALRWWKLPGAVLIDANRVALCTPLWFISPLLWRGFRWDTWRIIPGGSKWLVSPIYFMGHLEGVGRTRSLGDETITMGSKTTYESWDDPPGGGCRCHEDSRTNG